VASAALIAGGRHAFDVLERAVSVGVIALCGYMVGVGRAALDMAVAWAKVREQFDRPIGSFQGVAFPLAQSATELRAAEVLTMYCAWCLDNDVPAREAVATAKLFVGDACRVATQVASETFGGAGFMQETDVGLYLRRGKQLELSLGGKAFWEDTVATEILDGEASSVPWRL
jgi:alkylation response protein AidB-like acyl-CoA dehydrogenase